MKSRNPYRPQHTNVMGPLLSFILFYVSFPVREEWPLAGAATFSSSLDSQWVIRIESRRGQSRCGDMHGKCVAIISNGSYGLGRKNNVKRNLFKRWRGRRRRISSTSNAAGLLCRRLYFTHFGVISLYPSHYFVKISQTN